MDSDCNEGRRTGAGPESSESLRTEAESASIARTDASYYRTRYYDLYSLAGDIVTLGGLKGTKVFPLVCSMSNCE